MFQEYNIPEALFCGIGIYALARSNLRTEKIEAMP